MLLLQMTSSQPDQNWNPQLIKIHQFSKEIRMQLIVDRNRRPHQHKRWFDGPLRLRISCTQQRNIALPDYELAAKFDSAIAEPSSGQTRNRTPTLARIAR
jgi:hypothetical protein